MVVEIRTPPADHEVSRFLFDALNKIPDESLLDALESSQDRYRRK